MYRLIALDIDDTITLNPRVVPNEITEAVRKAKEHGIHVTVATGRGWAGLEAYNRSARHNRSRHKLRRRDGDRAQDRQGITRQ